MLRDLREKSGLTQEKLAYLTNISVKTISSIENGKDCSIRTVKKLSKYFGVSIEEIIERKDL